MQYLVALIPTICKLIKTVVYTFLSIYNANMMVLGAGLSLIALDGHTWVVEPKTPYK